jgi:hypothetical protein
MQQPQRPFQRWRQLQTVSDSDCGCCSCRLSVTAAAAAAAVRPVWGLAQASESSGNASKAQQRQELEASSSLKPEIGLEVPLRDFHLKACHVRDKGLKLVVVERMREGQVGQPVSKV